jgi:hypothetical protein
MLAILKIVCYDKPTAKVLLYAMPLYFFENSG